MFLNLLFIIVPYGAFSDILFLTALLYGIFIQLLYHITVHVFYVYHALYIKESDWFCLLRTKLCSLGNE